MQICVVSCSPKGELSLTLQAERFIEQWFGNDSFHVVMAHKGRLTEEMKQEVTESDMVLLLGSVFHLDIYSYMMELLDNMTKDEEFIQILREKPVTFLSTSGLQGDNYAHNTVTKWAVSHRMKWINSLSLHLSALLTDEGCEELFCWFNYVKSMAVCYQTGEHPTAKERGRVVLLDTASTEHQQLSADIQKAKQHFEISGFDVEIITLRDYTFKHCTGCMACYSNRRCCIKDDWHDVFNRLYLNTDMIVYFGVLHHATLGSTYRTFVERHASLGRCGMDDGCIKTFMVYKDEMSTAEDFADFRICFQGFEGLLRSYLSDVIDLDDKECDFITALDKMTVAYNNDVMPQTTFLGISMTRAFASTASVLKYQCSGDYRYFEEKGLYREILPDSHAQWLDGLKEAVASSMGRLIPYRMKLQHTEGVPVVHDRRPYKALPNCGKTYRLCGCCP